MSRHEVSDACLPSLAGVLPASLIGGPRVSDDLFVASDPSQRHTVSSFDSTWNLGNLYADPVRRRRPDPAGCALRYSVPDRRDAAVHVDRAAGGGARRCGAAIFLAEAVPVSRASGCLFWSSFLAAIPSVVFGLWGYAVVVPLLAHYVFPVPWRDTGLDSRSSAVPPAAAIGLLTAGPRSVADDRAADRRHPARRDRTPARGSARSLARARRDPIRDGVEGLAARPNQVLIGAAFLAPAGRSARPWPC